MQLAGRPGDCIQDGARPRVGEVYLDLIAERARQADACHVQVVGSYARSQSMDRAVGQENTTALVAGLLFGNQLVVEEFGYQRRDAGLAYARTFAELDALHRPFEMQQTKHVGEVAPALPVLIGHRLLRVVRLRGHLSHPITRLLGEVEDHDEYTSDRVYAEPGPAAAHYTMRPG